MHMRRMEDGYIQRRMQKNKHMQGHDLDTPKSSSLVGMQHRQDEGPSGKVKLAFDIVRGVFLAIVELIISLTRWLS